MRAVSVPLLFTLIATWSCSTASARDFGKFHPLDTVLTTQCASIRSFHSKLRSSPGLEAPDRFVGYLDPGGGLSRNPVFVISAVQFDAALSPGELLAQTDKRRNPFWAEASLVGGVIEIGKAFEAHVPAVQETHTSGATIVRREAILVRAHVQQACGKQYLVAVYSSPLASEEGEWKRVRQFYDTFLASIRWP